jgi:nicotinamide mononucleotide transporter PnuC
MKNKAPYFTPFEKILLSFSLLVTVLVFVIFDRSNYLNMLASMLGIVAVIFCAKGNPIGQALIIAFGMMYAYISFTYAYYGEMLTYLGMTTPMAIYALISWIRNPYGTSHSEVKVGKIGGRDIALLIPLTLLVTLLFYFILKHLGTSNLLVSTFSVSTSFVAVYFSARRSPLYALGYALNDVVLIILWIMASIEDSSYVSVVVCFSIFLLNDMYGFFNWQWMKKRQSINKI